MPDAAPTPPADPFGFVRTGSVDEARDDGAGRLEVRYQAGARLRLDALDDSILRVRYAAPGDDVGGDDSYALDPDAQWNGPTAWSRCDTDRDVGVETASLRVAIRRETGRLVVSDLDGRARLHEGSGAAWSGGAAAHTVRLDDGDRLYGLGDKALGLDRRGHRVEMWNTDAGDFGRGSDPLYKSVPFVLKVGEGGAVGLFYDDPARVSFDLDRATAGRMRWESPAPARATARRIDLYVLTAPTPLGVVRAFARVVGRTPMLPKWALGYHQSRYSYRDEGEVRAVAREFRERDIPCDALYFDIHYMRGFRVFTWDREAFPDPAGLLSDLAGDGFRSVAIVDPGVKADDPDYAVYRDGAARGAFVTDDQGRELRGEVWPGECAFPDFTDPDVRTWWGDLHRDLLDAGLDGVWNDMNEPAVFGTKHVHGVENPEFEVGTLPPTAQFVLDGRGGAHDAAHNVYGMQMQRATHEGLARLRPARRPFTITRAAYAGAQRFGTSWTGDNSATWDHLRLAAEQVLSLGLSGMPFTGADVGGFIKEPTGELLARWTQLGAVTPLFRNHSAIDSPRQEPWCFGDDVERACRDAIRLRMRLLPTLYTALWEAATEGTPMLRPAETVHPELVGADTFFVGEHVLAAPVLDEGATERTLRLPDGRWYEVDTGAYHVGGAAITVPAPLGRLPLFARGGAVVALAPPRPHTGVRVDRLELHVYAAPGRHSSRLYEDAGDGYGDSWLGTFAVDDTDDTLRVAVEVTGDYVPEWAGWDVVVWGLAAPPRRVAVGGVETVAAWSGGAARFAVPVATHASPVAFEVER